MEPIHEQKASIVAGKTRKTVLAGTIATMAVAFACIQLKDVHAQVQVKEVHLAWTAPPVPQQQLPRQILIDDSFIRIRKNQLWLEYTDADSAFVLRDGGE